MSRLFSHIRSNVVAYLALFVALGGTGYAATSLPRGSVGPQQLNHRLIGGYVRAWATVSASFQITSSSGGARVIASPPAGPVTVAWQGRFPRSQRACTVLAAPFSVGSAPPLVGFYEGRGKVSVTTSGGSYPQGISVALVC